MRDERGLIASWLGRVVVGLALFGVALFDSGAIAWNYFALDSAADDIAAALSTEITDRSLKGPAAIEAEARALAADAGAKLVEARLEPAGVLYVRLKREAKTIVVSRVEPARRWGVARAEGRAGTR